MKVDLDAEEKKPLMHRTDYVARVFVEGSTPSRRQIAKAVAKKTGGKEELVVVRRVRATFGEPASIVDVSVYETQDALDEYEMDYMRERHQKGGAEEKKESPEKPKEPEESGDKKDKPSDAAKGSGKTGESEEKKDDSKDDPKGKSDEEDSKDDDSEKDDSGKKEGDDK